MKCSNCFNECREGLLFCNICGAMLLAENSKPQSYTIPNTNFAASGTQAQSSPVQDTAYTAPQQNNTAFQTEEKKETFENVFDETKDSKIKRPPEPMPERMEYPETKREKAKREAEFAKENFELLNDKKDDGAKPLSRGQFTAMELLMYVPVVNIILLLIWSFNKNGNPNRRNYAIAKLICIPLLFVASVIVLVALYATGIFDSLIASLENYLV